MMPSKCPERHPGNQTAYSTDCTVEIANINDNVREIGETLIVQMDRIPKAEDVHSDSEDTGTENDDFQADDESPPSNLFDENHIVVQFSNIKLNDAKSRIIAYKDTILASDGSASLDVSSPELRRLSQCSDEGYVGEDEPDDYGSKEKKMNITESDPESGLVIGLQNCKISIETQNKKKNDYDKEEEKKQEEGEDDDDEEEEEEEVSRGPMKGNVTSGKQTSEPYHKTKSQYLHNGGYLWQISHEPVSAPRNSNFQVSPSPVYSAKPVDSTRQKNNFILTEEHYLSDEAERLHINELELNSSPNWDELYDLEEFLKDVPGNENTAEVVTDWQQLENMLQAAPPADQSNSQCVYETHPNSVVNVSSVHQSTNTLSIKLGSTESQQTMMSPAYSPAVSVNSPDSGIMSDSSLFSPPSSVPPESPATPQPTNSNLNSISSFQLQPSSNVVIWQTPPANSTSNSYVNCQPDALHVQGIAATSSAVNTVNIPDRSPVQIRRPPIPPQLINESAAERLSLDAENKRRAFHRLSKYSDEELFRKDPDGDTPLMIAIAGSGQQNEQVDLEMVFALVHRYKKIRGALEARNHQNYSALMLACMVRHKQPLIARLIAEALLIAPKDPKDDLLNEEYENSNTIIHMIVEKGDEYLDLLVELLSIKDSNGQRAFDIEKRSTLGTPLTVATKFHGQVHGDGITDCSRIITFLINQGASLSETEHCGGMTPLHLAIKEGASRLVVEIIIKAAHQQGIDLVNKRDYQGNTPLHYAYLRNDIPIQRQVMIISLLLQYGAVQARGSQGRLPLALVTCPDRKEHIRACFHTKKSRRP